MNIDFFADDPNGQFIANYTIKNIEKLLLRNFATPCCSKLAILKKLVPI